MPSARRLVLALWVVVCGLVLTVSLWSPSEVVRTEDQNHDGRPDIWRFYDRQGRLHRVEVDTNFDGRADRRDFYRDGILTRTETDRNFDNQIDLIEEFDLRGREHVRSVVDANFDGTADLLVLFQDGQPVHSEWRTPATGQLFAPLQKPPRPAEGGERVGVRGGTLAALDDPFESDAALRASHRPRAPDTIGVTVPTVMLLEPPAVAARPGTAFVPFTLPLVQDPHSTIPHAQPARAPPPQSRLG
jgi:hypothetical protein